MKMMRLIYLYLVLLMSVHVVSSRMPEGLLSHVQYTYISLRPLPALETDGKSSYYFKVKLE